MSEPYPELERCVRCRTLVPDRGEKFPFRITFSLTLADSTEQRQDRNDGSVDTQEPPADVHRYQREDAEHPGVHGGIPGGEYLDCSSQDEYLLPELTGSSECPVLHRSAIRGKIFS